MTRGILYQNNVISDIADRIPGNDALFVPAEQTAQCPLSRYHQCNDPSRAQFNVNITHKSQTGSVADIDDLLASKVGDRTPLSRTAVAHGIASCMALQKSSVDRRPSRLYRFMRNRQSVFPTVSTLIPSSQPSEAEKPASRTSCSVSALHAP